MGGLAVVVTGATVVVFGSAVVVTGVVDVVGAAVELVVVGFSVVVVTGVVVSGPFVVVVVEVVLCLVSGGGVSVNGLIPGFLLVGSGGGDDVWAETMRNRIKITRKNKWNNVKQYR